jgi:hypothetical protein
MESEVSCQGCKCVVWMMLCAACSKGASSLEVAPGSSLEIRSGADVQVTVRVPARVLVYQHRRKLFSRDVAPDARFPHEISIPVRSLDDGSHEPMYVVALDPEMIDGAMDLVPQGSGAGEGSPIDAGPRDGGPRTPRSCHSEPECICIACQPCCPPPPSSGP